MASGGARRRYGQDPFTDMLFNVLLVLSLLFALALVFINPPARDGNVDSKAEYLITVSWPDGSTADIDTWVRDGAGRLCWFKDRDQGLMHLDRDDRGAQNDTVLVDGKTVVNPLNQEIVTLRGIEPGDYTVNLHYYKSVDREPVLATVQVMRINPVAQIAWRGEVALDRPGQEKTAITFTLDAGGRVVGTRFDPVRLVRQ